jgi:uncharacterized membrane protein YhiD involved in acid resistance
MICQQLSLPSTEPTSLQALAVDLALVLLFSQLLAWHFVRYAQVLSNKRKLARVLVFISTTTLLIITVVKTSLALSLGLVGALSIIRFRTPIKEPEELAYLFLAIAVGVGLGANRPYETALVFVVVLVAMALRSHLPGGKSPLRTLLQVTSTAETDQAAALAKLIPAVTDHSTRCELRRVDCDAEQFHANLLIELHSLDSLQTLLGSIQAALPGSSVSVIERDGME